MPRDKEAHVRQKQKLDEQLDLELMQTFPASDPLTITRSPRKRQLTKADSDDKDQEGG